MSADRTDLGRLLAEEAELGVPPETAESVRLAGAAGGDATPLLLERVRARGADALLALEALRAADPTAYGQLPATERAEVYSDALRTSGSFNAWGLPGVQLTSTADAVVELGPAAVDVLAPLLHDQRTARLRGSQDATTSGAYGNRVADYAFVLISRILGLPFEYDLDPRARDRAIADLRAQLER